MPTGGSPSSPPASANAIDIAMRVLAAGIIDPPGLTKARDAARLEGVGLICAMVRHSLVDTKALAAFLGQTLRMRVIDLDLPEAERLGATAPVVPEPLCRRYRVMPIGVGYLGSERILHLAMSDPTDGEAIGAISKVAKLAVQPYLVEDGALERALLRRFQEPDVDDEVSIAPTMPSFASPRERTSPQTLEPLNAQDAVSLDASLERQTDDDQELPRNSFQVPTEVLSMDELGIRSAPSASAEAAAAEDFDGPRNSTTVDYGVRPGMKRKTLDDDDSRDLFSEETKIANEDDLRDAAVIGKAPKAVDHSTEPNSEISRLRLCIVVTDAELRARLRLDLNRAIDHVAAVRSLSEAVALVPTEQFDLVMVHMPRNDVKTGQLLNELGRTHSIATIVFSDDPEFDGLTGVMARLPPPGDPQKIAGMLLRVVRVAARSIRT